jgi:hypothetical protein
MTHILNRRTLALAACVLALVTAMSSSAYALGKGSVTSRAIKNGAVKTVDLARNAVTSAKVRDASLTGADLADGSVTSADLAAGTVGTQDLAQGSVGAQQLGVIVTVENRTAWLGDEDGTTNGGTFGTVWTRADCPAGTLAIGGGADWVEPTSGSVDTKNLYLHSSKRLGNSWYARGIVDIGAQGDVKLRVFVDCLTGAGLQN